ncbi:MAG: hypothetical protein ACKVP6_09080, partial [Mycobacterium sp.]
PSLHRRARSIRKGPGDSSVLAPLFRQRDALEAIIMHHSARLDDFAVPVMVARGGPPHAFNAIRG